MDANCRKVELRRGLQRELRSFVDQLIRAHANIGPSFGGTSNIRH